MVKHHSVLLLGSLKRKKPMSSFFGKRVILEVYSGLVIYYTISWCKITNLFASYAYASVMTNWESFL